tara:strand:- start:292 stop:786 length:495 start_codon:yes stop_codon:yes gene_type:complete
MIQFRTAEERDAMKKQRKRLRGMRKGVDNSRMQNRGGEYGGSITNEEQRAIQSGKEKIRSNIQNIGVAAATSLATGGLGTVAGNTFNAALQGAQQAGDVSKALRLSRAADNFDRFRQGISQAGNMVDVIREMQGYGVNPGAEETTEPSGPEYQYDFFTPYSLDE